MSDPTARQIPHNELYETAALEMFRERDRLLREYLTRIATKVGHRDAIPLDNVHVIERFGEAVMAELERREDATLNSELNVHTSTSDSESTVHSARFSDNVEWERYQRMWGRPLSEHDQAQMDALQARMETEERAR